MDRVAPGFGEKHYLDLFCGLLGTVNKHTVLHSESSFPANRDRSEEKQPLNLIFLKPKFYPEFFDHTWLMKKTPRGGVWGTATREVHVGTNQTSPHRRTTAPSLTAKKQPWKDQTHELWGSFFPHPRGQGWGHIKNTHTHLTDGIIFPTTAAASYWSDLKVIHSSWKARNVSERHREMKSSLLSEKCSRASVSLRGKLTVGGVLAWRERGAELKSENLMLHSRNTTTNRCWKQDVKAARGITTT